ncbi:PRC-barrel domain containing protein [bacterium]|nr:MAG: PRC-barrel domain containing protein [bacterium]
MQTLFNDLRGRSIYAEDGIGGRVEDIFFDDRSGSVRHVVFSRGLWPNKQRGVLAPDLVSIDLESEGHLSAAITCAEMQRAPHPDSCPPISRQIQLNLDPNAVPDDIADCIEPASTEPSVVANETKNGLFNKPELTLFDGLLKVHRYKQDMAHLRSVRAVCGYSVEIEDGRIGKVADVWLDTATWQLAHLSVSLDSVKQRVAVPLSLVRGISCNTQTIRLSACWSYEGGEFCLEPRVAPPRDRLRSLGSAFRFSAFPADVTS